MVYESPNKFPDAAIQDLQSKFLGACKRVGINVTHQDPFVKRENPQGKIADVRSGCLLSLFPYRNLDDLAPPIRRWSSFQPIQGPSFAHRCHPSTLRERGQASGKAVRLFFRHLHLSPSLIKIVSFGDVSVRPSVIETRFIYLKLLRWALQPNVSERRSALAQMISTG